ncbi:MAG: hypothetical protein R6X08_06075 [Desulfosalsimonadaceae bacterium]
MNSIPIKGPENSVMQLIRSVLFFTVLASFLAATAGPAAATQTHGPPEGLYVHQFSHLFFIVAMAILIYWLRSRRLVQETGWRHIQFAALFFLLWSLDAFFVHILDEQILLVKATRAGPWRIHLSLPEGYSWLAFVYYPLKLDHLLCVPGLFFLYTGVRRLFVDKQIPAGREGEKP